MHLFSEADILVYDFINSTMCGCFKDLEYYLRRKHLPLLKTWLYYFLGSKCLVTSAVNKQAMEEIDRLPFDHLSLLLERSQLWEYYLDNKDSYEKEIIESYHLDRLETPDLPPVLEPFPIYIILINQGWKMVDKQITDILRQHAEFKKWYYGDKTTWSPAIIEETVYYNQDMYKMIK